MESASTTYGFNSAFPTRFRTLLDARNITQQELADLCGVRRQSISQWTNGNTKPDILALEKLARFFNVSADYLLGLNSQPTTDVTVSSTCDYLGLSQNSVLRLLALNNSEEDQNGNPMDFFLNNLFPSSYALLHRLYAYKQYVDHLIQEIAPLIEKLEQETKKKLDYNQVLHYYRCHPEEIPDGAFPGEENGALYFSALYTEFQEVRAEITNIVAELLLDYGGEQDG